MPKSYASFITWMCLLCTDFTTKNASIPVHHTKNEVISNCFRHVGFFKAKCKLPLGQFFKEALPLYSLVTTTSFIRSFQMKHRTWDVLLSVKHNLHVSVNCWIKEPLMKALLTTRMVMNLYGIIRPIPFNKKQGWFKKMAEYTLK